MKMDLRKFRRRGTWKFQLYILPFVLRGPLVIQFWFGSDIRPMVISVNCFGSKKMRPCNSWLRFPKMYVEKRFQGWTNFTISSVSSTLINSSHFHYNPSALLLFFNTFSTFLPGWKGPRPDRIVWGAQLTQSRSSWSCYPNKLPNGRYSYVSAWPCFRLQTKNKKQFGS